MQWDRLETFWPKHVKSTNPYLQIAKKRKWKAYDKWNILWNKLLIKLLNVLDHFHIPPSKKFIRQPHFTINFPSLPSLVSCSFCLCLYLQTRNHLTLPDPKLCVKGDCQHLDNFYYVVQFNLGEDMFFVVMEVSYITVGHYFVIHKWRHGIKLIWRNATHWVGLRYS